MESMDNEQPDNGGGNVAIAFLLGVVAGAALALLFAPASGADMRRAMNRRTREGRDRVVEALRQGRGLVDEQREHLTGAFERARRKAQSTPGEPEPGA